MNIFSNPNNQWKRFTLLRLFAFLIISFSPNAIANSLKDYCLSKTEPKETLREVRTDGLSSSWSERLNKKVNMNGEDYIVSAEDGLQIIREKDNLIVSERSIWDFLEKDDSINALYITENEWLFIDADKKEYVDYFNLILDKGLLNPQGFILVDNTLLQGQPYLPEKERTANGEGVASFNRVVAEDSRVEQVILPLRDGLSIIRRK